MSPLPLLTGMGGSIFRSGAMPIGGLKRDGGGLENAGEETRRG
jgi:hypothetical protein